MPSSRGDPGGRSFRLEPAATDELGAIWCYWAADAPDPNGTEYRGGWSGSLLLKGKKVEIDDAEMGDIAFYGTSRSDIGHVTVYVGQWKCVSHGQEIGPMQYPMDYDLGSSGGLQLVRTYLT